MFTAARLKLTAWYLLIIMLISLAFSGIIYHETTQEVQRSLRAQWFRIAREQGIFPSPFSPPEVNPQLLQEANDRIKLILLLINLGILGVSGAAGYFLAGKTLKPIEQMVDEQKRFIADASHELRTPLTAIKSEIEVALRDKNLNLPQARKLLKSNLEETDKMQSLSNYLLELSRYQNDSVKTPMEKVAVVQAVQKAIQKLEPPARKKGITIETNLKNIEITGNADSLVQLFTILLDNAIKYSHEKGKIIVKTHKSGANAIVSVQDFGIGIKQSDVPYIFNRFYRADTSRSKTQVEGYGLGLAIAKSIVDLHKGEIFVVSSPNSGSIFTVTL